MTRPQSERPVQKIMLTDYPKTQSIEANYRGVETDVLVHRRTVLYHTMMDYNTEEHAGYSIMWTFKGIEKELDWRKVAYDE
jgi:hypothetical protein